MRYYDRKMKKMSNIRKNHYKNYVNMDIINNDSRLYESGIGLYEDNSRLCEDDTELYEVCMRYERRKNEEDYMCCRKKL